MTTLYGRAGACSRLTESYTYDGYGNLLTFNNGVQTLSFGYGNDQWKDQLTTVTKGNTTKTITYDAVGNPTSFYDGFLYSMEWSEGRNLTKLHYHYDEDDPSAARTTTYQYNADGLRTKKINPNGTYTVYHIADGRYVGETQFTADNKVILYIRYVLDESGSVVGIGLWKSGDVAWTDFYFLKNLQGDIIAVYRESDNALMASYEYDAWGNIVAAHNYAYFADKAIKDLNPFRYRGYYYDNETWFYYLQSRYYDPAIGRFINADNVVSGIGGIFQGYNLFAYCFNNPICLSDSSGQWPFEESLINIGKAIAEKFKETWDALTVIHDVPLYYQGDYNLCWAFCQVMVEDYHNGVTRTNDQATARAKEIAISVHGEYDQYGNETWDQGGLPTNIVDKFPPNSTHELLSLLEDGPIYAYYWNGKSGDAYSGHLIVVTGVNVLTNTVYTNNPWKEKGIQTFEEFMAGVYTKSGYYDARLRALYIPG